LALDIVTAAVTRALKLVLGLDPVRRAPEMRALCVNDEKLLRLPDHPDAMRLLEALIHAGPEVRRKADSKLRARLKERARKEESEKHQEACTEKCGDRGPDQLPPQLQRVRQGRNHLFGCRAGGALHSWLSDLRRRRYAGWSYSTGNSNTGV